MTDLSVSDTTDLEQLVNDFADTYADFKSDTPDLNIAAHDIKDALSSEECTDWTTVYDSLELIALSFGGEIRAQATTLMGLIMDQGLVEV